MVPMQSVGTMRMPLAGLMKSILYDVLRINLHEEFYRLICSLRGLFHHKCVNHVRPKL